MSFDYFLYVGTYTRGDSVSEGIYVYKLDSSSGATEYVDKATGIEDPSFLAIDPGHRHLYATGETGDMDGSGSGSVTSYAIDPSTGKLTYLDSREPGGTVSCHLIVDATGRFVLAANYGTGSVATFPIEEDGSLGEVADFVQHEGSSVNPDRQQGPHAHSINLDANNRFAFAPDLGADKIVIYEFDSTRGTLTPTDDLWAQVRPGAGPRHFDFHPSGDYAYVINELDSTVTAFTYDSSSGSLREFQTVSTLPDDFDGVTHCADIHVHQSGKFVYGSNRGHDSIAIFAVDASTGRLSPVAIEPTQGRTPRNFAIDPTGTLLLAANQESSNVVAFRIDQETGELDATGEVTEVPTPVCLKLVPMQ